MKTCSFVEPALETDVTEIRDLYLRSWHQAFDRLHLDLNDDTLIHRAHLDLDRQDVLVYRDTPASQIRGFVAGHRLVGAIEKLYVDVDAQGQGIGSALLTTFVAECSLRPCLWVSPDNQPAVAFYRARGWTETGLHRAPKVGSTNICYLELIAPVPQGQRLAA